MISTPADLTMDTMDHSNFTNSTFGPEISSLFLHYDDDGEDPWDEQQRTMEFEKAMLAAAHPLRKESASVLSSLNSPPTSSDPLVMLEGYSAAHRQNFDTPPSKNEKASDFNAVTPTATAGGLHVDPAAVLEMNISETLFPAATVNPSTRGLPTTSPSRLLSHFTQSPSFPTSVFSNSPSSVDLLKKWGTESLMDPTAEGDTHPSSSAFTPSLFSFPPSSYPSSPSTSPSPPPATTTTSSGGSPSLFTTTTPAFPTASFSLPAATSHEKDARDGSPTPASLFSRAGPCRPLPTRVNEEEEHAGISVFSSSIAKRKGNTSAMSVEEKDLCPTNSRRSPSMPGATLTGSTPSLSSSKEGDLPAAALTETREEEWSKLLTPGLSSYPTDGTSQHPSSLGSRMEKLWVKVLHLPYNTTGVMLMSAFYPHGADEARTVRQKNALIGLVRFRSSEMAARASDKVSSLLSANPMEEVKVVPISWEEVEAIFTQTKLNPVSTLYTALSDPTFGVSRVATMIQRMPYLEAARQIADEVVHADSVMLTRITQTLLSLSRQWEHFHDFGTELKQRLYLALIETNCSFQSASCGVVLGHLYRSGFLPPTEDPFRFATNFLQRIGLSVTHVQGICVLAHFCSSMEFRVSKAGFWAVVRAIAEKTADPATKNALLHHLQRYLKYCVQQDVALPSPSRQCLLKHPYHASSSHESNEGGHSSSFTPAFTPSSSSPSEWNSQNSNTSHTTILQGSSPTAPTPGSGGSGHDAIPFADSVSHSFGAGSTGAGPEAAGAASFSEPDGHRYWMNSPPMRVPHEDATHPSLRYSGSRGQLNSLPSLNAGAAMSGSGSGAASGTSGLVPFSTSAWPSSSAGSLSAFPKGTGIPSSCSGLGGDAKFRTVYISHLLHSMPQNVFMDFLTRCGCVNKVRICAGKGYSTLFSFVEMGTIQGARETMKLNGMSYMNFSFRVQTAKNPIQDELKEDAQVDSSTGLVVQECLFGTTSAPLIRAISATDIK